MTSVDSNVIYYYHLITKFIQDRYKSSSAKIKAAKERQNRSPLSLSNLLNWKILFPNIQSMSHSFKIMWIAKTKIIKPKDWCDKWIWHKVDYDWKPNILPLNKVCVRICAACSFSIELYMYSYWIELKIIIIKKKHRSLLCK